MHFFIFACMYIARLYLKLDKETNVSKSFAQKRVFPLFHFIFK